MNAKHVYDRLVRILRRKMLKTGGIMRIQKAAAVPRNTINQAASRKEPFLLIHLLRILEAMDLSPVTLFREVMTYSNKGDESVAALGARPRQRRIPCQSRLTYSETFSSIRMEAVEAFLRDAPPLPEIWRKSYAVATDGFTDPILPADRDMLDKIDKLRPEEPAKAAELCPPLIASLNLNVSIRAMVLGGSSLRLMAQLPSALAVLTKAYRLACLKNHKSGLASCLYELSYLIADLGYAADAILVAESAAIAYMSVGDKNGVMLSQFGKANFLYYCERPAEALSEYRACISTFGITGYMLTLSKINMAWSALDMENINAAKGLVAEIEVDNCLEDLRHLDSARLTWLRARVSEEDYTKAVQLYRHAAVQLEAWPQDLVLMTLDKSAFFLRSGNFEEASKAAEAATIIAEPLAKESKVVAAAITQLRNTHQISHQLLASARRTLAFSKYARTIQRTARAR